jgi:KUP system potassium uptake protein
MAIVHTSADEAGQIYVPLTNWSLYAAVMALVVGFQSSSNLAAAYGIAVTLDMLITTVLTFFVIRYGWGYPLWLCVLATGFFFAIDLAFFSSNLLKLFDGGWFPLLIALVSFTVLTTWKTGRKLVFEGISAQGMPIAALLASLGDDVHRVDGTAVFMTGNRDNAPSALLHNLMHNQVVHQRVFLLTVVTEEKPFIPADQRIEYVTLGKGFHRLVLHYGFMEHPDIPEALAQCHRFGHDFDMMRTTFYLSREIIVPTPRQGMALWRERLFALMNRNATPASEFFRIPTNRVVELGTKLEI